MAPPFPLPLREALNHSISSGRFADTKIVLYSRRDSSGTISRPRALYANSHVLKSVPYFSDRESHFPHAYTIPNDPLQVLSGTFAESELKDFSEPIDENERAENYGYHSDSDLEDDEDATNVPKLTKKAAGPKKDTPDPLLFPANAKMPAPTYGEYEEPSGKGMIVKIRDVAFITYVSLKSLRSSFSRKMQVPGLFSVSIHRLHQFCALRVRGKSQVEKFGDHLLG